MGEHTPGPWIAEGATVKATSHGQWFKITRADGLRHTKEANERNARLIAAAPEMYAKLVKIRTWLEKLLAHAEEAAKDGRFQMLQDAYRADAKNYRATIANINEAINKAEGQ